ncbi:MAG: hypothetical protein NVS9B10_11100 [Nevskia sp.]
MVAPELLDEFVPLDGLSRGNRNKLAQKLTMQTALAGEHLFRIGDPAGPTLYLADGIVQLEDDIGRRIVIRAGEPTAKHPLAPAPVRRVEARCVTDCRFLAVDPELLDVMLTWDQGRALDIGDHGKVHGDDDEDWMVRLLQLPIFHRVPPSNLYAMFQRIKPIASAAGQVLIRQDDAGDYFYVLVEGRCSITRRAPAGPAISLAEIEAGSCFGEEALISDEPRNATVTMLTPGRLMRLAKEDFRALLSDPLARTITYPEAVERIAAGTAQWLDVRLPGEFRTGSLSRSVNLPLHLLRLKLAQLDPNLTYLTICDTGRRSSIAAWLLNQRGFDAYRLNSGLPAGP